MGQFPAFSPGPEMGLCTWALLPAIRRSPDQSSCDLWCQSNHSLEWPKMVVCLRFNPIFSYSIIERISIWFLMWRSNFKADNYLFHNF
jgi:hypothetical protein